MQYFGQKLFVHWKLFEQAGGSQGLTGQYPAYFCTKRFPVRLFRSSRFAAQADAGVALSAVMFVSFPEVVQQHTAAAYGVVGYVVEHGIDTRFIEIGRASCRERV